jgi:hypothetical protein
MPKRTEIQELSIYDCSTEPAHLDWEAARRLWEIHVSHGPDCIPQLVAGAVLSDEA